MKLSGTILKRTNKLIIVLLLLIGLYLKIFCSECLIQGIQAGQIILIAGTILCFIKLSIVSIKIRNKKLPWQQFILPAFLLTQLLLLTTDKISSIQAIATIAFVEVILVSGVIIAVRRSIKTSENYQTSLQNSLSLFLPPKIAQWMKVEIIILSAAFYGISRFFRIPVESGWSYWKKSAFPLIFVMLVLVSPVEFLVVDILLNIKSIVVQVGSVFLYLWSLLWVYGFWVTVKLSPHQISEEEICLHKGALATTNFSLNLIKSVRIIPPKTIGEEEPKIMNGAKFTVPGTPRVELILKKPVEIRNSFLVDVYSADSILISVDEPDKFCREINKYRTPVL